MGEPLALELSVLPFFSLTQKGDGHRRGGWESHTIQMSTPSTSGSYSSAEERNRRAAGGPGEEGLGGAGEFPYQALGLCD